VYLFHGLATEDSSPPWTLSAYSDEQIELMKAVRLAIHSFVALFQVTRTCMLPMCCKYYSLWQVLASFPALHP